MYIIFMSDIISKLFTVTLVVLPAMNVYRSPIPSVELGTLIILACAIFFFCLRPGIGRPEVGSLWIYLLLVFFVCTSISSIILGYNSSEYSKVFFRFVKIVIIVISITAFGKEHFDYQLAIKALKTFSLFCAIYIIIQNLGYYVFGTRILGVYFPLASSDDYTELNTIQKLMYRPCAVFFEPAHYAAYSLVYLCWLLTHSNENYRNWQIILMVVGLLFSTSGTAFVILPIIFIVLILFKVKDGTIAFHNAWKYIIVFSIVAVLICLFFMSDIGRASLGRFIEDDGSIGGATTGRLQSGAFGLFQQLPSILQLIGCGFGYRPDDVYFPSIYAILYGDGYLGLGMFIILLTIYYMKSNQFGKMLCITYSLLFIGTGVFNFASIGLYFSLIMADIEELEI